MGASVGIGGLIIGTTMLVVFSMVVASIDAKVDTSLQTIDSATEALPVFTIDDATLWEGAVVDVQIGSGGSGYVNGTLVSSTGNGGFAGTFTVNVATGAITAVAITSHGNYSSAPTIVVQGQTPTSSASFVVSIGNFIHSNVTNTGSYITPLREAWLFSDGANPTNLGTVFRTGTNNPHWYSGETLHIQWDESGTLPVERFALSVRGVNMASSLA